eukprot:CAMPEP_0170491232 /NCGR_PEP_ID=MMETSP0208-20121228/10654_1 /TAXON_ID=197538 /ORGANISM="Strombidium inclinatum, Strain S3" /LENGTH=50 /DNA_ID=CAMNT_0010766775 /DNA_START=409 /DNA_END=561 /DNA_ORIENTATION=+
MRAEAYIQYTTDKSTYDNAKVTLDFMFAEAMELFKLGFYGFFNLLNTDDV